jgi:hypothetical protein
VDREKSAEVLALMRSWFAKHGLIAAAPADSK